MTRLRRRWCNSKLTGMSKSGSDSITYNRDAGADFSAPSVVVAPHDGAGNIRIATWVGIFIAAALPLVSPFLPLIGPPADSGVHITKVAGLTVQFAVDSAALGHFVANVEHGIVFKWVCSLALVLLVVLWERKPLASIGLRRVSWRDLVVVIGGYLVVFGIGHLLDLVLPKHVPSDVQLATMLFPFPLRAAMVLTAAVTEEIESRGYLIERLETITGSTSLAAILAYLVFLLEHAASWDIAHALRITLWTTALIVLYLWRRSLPACISLHFLADATALLAVPKIR